RTFGIPEMGIIKSLKNPSSVPLNILQLQWPDGRKRFAFNMVGGALDAAVVNLLDARGFQRAGLLKYPIALIFALMKPHTWRATVAVDDKILDGEWLTIQAGFGKYCGGGMYVLPHSTEKEAGLLLMKPKSFFKLITSLPKLYNGKISQQHEAIASSFSKIEIYHFTNPIPIEADGEWLGYSPVTIQSVEGRINILVSS
ncbi:MAG TPA: hypothetical protein VMZ69_00230, partial [Saprospiraceae bacterium]|nr:hypothetical protein [Saprospiraceae bacterium]